eukprot:222848_1
MSLEKEAKNEDEDTPNVVEHKLKKRSVHFIVENEKKQQTPGVQRWLEQKELMRKMYDDINFKSLSSHSRLKKEMTEASAQMTMIDWLSVHFDPHLMESQGSDYLIIDICAGKGFFGVLISHILPQSQIILLDKNKKINTKHFDSCTNVSFNIVDIRAHKFSLSKWIRNKFNEYNKSKLILFGTHLCGELSQVVIDAFNELPDLAWCLFLVPCCFPKRDKIVTKAKELSMDTMDYWLQLLQNQVSQTSEDHILLECMQMKDMLSTKNHLIRAIRTQLHRTHNAKNIYEKRYNEPESEPPFKKRKIMTT